MTPAQYWDEDCQLAKWYRKADELRRKRKNEELWLQGMYIYEALCCVAPVLHAMAKGGTKPAPYPTKPYPITPEEIRAEQERRERERLERMKDRLRRAIGNLKVPHRGVKDHE